MGPLLIRAALEALRRDTIAHNRAILDGRREFATVTGCHPSFIPLIGRLFMFSECGRESNYEPDRLGRIIFPVFPFK